MQLFPPQSCLYLSANMSFGWCTGDTLAAISLVNRITSSIQSIGGTRKHFQELPSELNGLEQALQEVASLPGAPVQLSEVAALNRFAMLG